MVEPQETIYYDLALSLAAHPVTGNLKTVKNTDSIRQSVKIIVMTNFYEKPYNPRFGGNIIAQLFENMTDITRFQIEKNIKLAIDNYEPRAEVIDVRVQALEDQNQLNVTVIFKPINEIQPQTISVMLERLR